MAKEDFENSAAKKNRMVTREGLDKGWKRQNKLPDRKLDYEPKTPQGAAVRTTVRQHTQADLLRGERKLSDASQKLHTDHAFSSQHGRSRSEFKAAVERRERSAKQPELANDHKRDEMSRKIQERETKAKEQSTIGRSDFNRSIGRDITR